MAPYPRKVDLDPGSYQTARDVPGIVDSVSLYLKREALAQGKMTEGLKIWLDPSIIDEKKIAAARPPGWRSGAFEKGLRQRLALKNAERAMMLKRKVFLQAYRNGRGDPAEHRKVLRRAVDRVKILHEEGAIIEDAIDAEEKENREVIYLITGRNVVQPGAYGSWSSANAQYTGVTDATSQSYKIWEELESAWFADCERGDHGHGPPQSRSRSSPDSAILSPSSARSSASSPAATSPSACPTSSPRLRSPSSPSPSSQPPASPCTRSCPPPRPAARTARPPPRAKPHLATIPIPGKMVYAVRANGQGVVFDDFEQARGLYYQAQAQGHSASLACTPSLTDGVCWLEGFVVGQTSVEAARRRLWIGEERTARQRRVTDNEGLDQVGYDWEASDSLSSDESDLSTELEL
ncbi:hypothetical protein DFH06DRAFT_1327721 [Mycena polygramma]|nr:hypothetical protein DFH06DRAFT_1327721 [Mycena polygramma]